MRVLVRTRHCTDAGMSGVAEDPLGTSDETQKPLRRIAVVVLGC